MNHFACFRWLILCSCYCKTGQSTPPRRSFLTQLRQCPFALWECVMTATTTTKWVVGQLGADKHITQMFDKKAVKFINVSGSSTCAAQTQQYIKVRDRIIHFVKAICCGCWVSCALTENKPLQCWNGIKSRPPLLGDLSPVVLLHIRGRQNGNAPWFWKVSSWSVRESTLKSNLFLSVTSARPTFCLKYCNILIYQCVFAKMPLLRCHDTSVRSKLWYAWL